MNTLSPTQAQAGGFLTLRPTGFSEMESIRLIAIKSFYDTYADQIPFKDILPYMGSVFSTTGMKAQWLDPNVTFIGAYVGESLVGFAKVTTKGKIDESAHTCFEIEKLYLANEYKGRSIGSALLSYCVNLAVTRGFDAIWLRVWEGNFGAIKFYHRNGFTEFGFTMLMPNLAHRGIWMKKKLDVPKIEEHGRHWL